MPKNKISEYSATAADNTDIGGINIAEGMAPSDVNNAMREQMSQLKEFLDGSSGDTITTAKIVATTATIASGMSVTGTATFNSAVVMSSSISLTTPLSVASGGTGVTSSTGTGSVVLSASPTFTGTVTTAAISMADNLLTRSVLKDYAIEGSAVGNTGSTETFDLTNANFFSATLDQASTFTFSNPPASGDFGTFVIELTNGGAFTITWPASVDWPGGSAPTLTASGKDQLVFTTRDGGTTWFGFVAGLDIKSP